jgi:hypothetical protein
MGGNMQLPEMSYHPEKGLNVQLDNNMLGQIIQSLQQRQQQGPQGRQQAGIGLVKQVPPMAMGQQMPSQWAPPPGGFRGA